LTPPLPRAFLVDDEPLATRRLARLLEDTSRVTVVGTSQDPREALALLERTAVDVLFLDIEMPGMDGFDLAARLTTQPFIVFTTAFDRYALRAFEVNSIDYLLKPVERAALDRALDKLERIVSGKSDGWSARSDVRSLLEEISRSVRAQTDPRPTRLASRVGDRIQVLEVEKITHFFAKDKLTWAVVAGRAHCVDPSIAELERRLDPSRFVRIHRSILVNLDFVLDVHAPPDGGARLRLRDEAKTELPVARDRAHGLKESLGLLRPE
jgi:two-component system LytT family response regulator